MKRKLKGCIIGTGRIAGLLQDDPLRKGVVTHIGAYREFSGKISIAACASSTLENAKSFSEKFSIPTYYDNFQEMLRREKPDIISICAYTESRLEMVRAAAEAGVRGIFCEKPIAASLAEADEIVRICQEARIAFSVNHTRRWEEAYRFARELIRKKQIGQVLHATGYCSGAIFHTGTHLFDVLHFFFGPTRSVVSRFDVSTKVKPRSKNELLPFRHEDHDAAALLRFQNNVEAIIYGLRRDYFIFELDIQGTEGRIRIGNHLFEVYQANESTHYSGFRELSRVPLLPKPNMPSALVRAVDELIQAVRKNPGTKQKLISGAEDARAALEVVFGILESQQKKGREIFLPLKTRKKRVLAR